MSYLITKSALMAFKRRTVSFSYRHRRNMPGLAALTPCLPLLWKLLPLPQLFKACVKNTVWLMGMEAALRLRQDQWIYFNSPAIVTSQFQWQSKKDVWIHFYLKMLLFSISEVCVYVWGGDNTPRSLNVLKGIQKWGGLRLGLCLSPQSSKKFLKQHSILHGISSF